MTEDEKKHLSDVAQLGCIACQKVGYGWTPAEVHHIRAGVGMSQRASHYETIPLCPEHHRYGPDAIHVSPQTFVRLFGSEWELLELVREELNSYRASFVGGR